MGSDGIGGQPLHLGLKTHVCLAPEFAARFAPFSQHEDGEHDGDKKEQNDSQLREVRGPVLHNSLHHI